MSAGPIEYRLEIPDETAALALYLEHELKIGVQAVKVEKLLSPVVVRSGRRMTAKQIHSTLAIIGAVYLKAVAAARDRRIRDTAEVTEMPQ